MLNTKNYRWISPSPLGAISATGGSKESFFISTGESTARCQCYKPFFFFYDLHWSKNKLECLSLSSFFVLVIFQNRPKEFDQQTLQLILEQIQLVKKENKVLKL
jgi:hypothetical protein